LEAEVVDWADDVTYAVHDMDDFYRAGLVPLDRLCDSEQERADLKGFLATRHPERSDQLADAADRLFTRLLSINTRYEGRAEERVNLRTLASALITRYINAVELTDAAGEVEFRIDDQVDEEVAVLKDLSWCYVIERPALAILQRGQREVIRGLFNCYAEAVETGDLRIFPAAYRERIDQAATEPAKTRAIVDLIAGLTEQAALEIYQRVRGMRTGSLLGAAGRLG
jgi:dGTPase